MTGHFVAFWNLENLFAPEDYGNREEWIAKKMKSDLKGWTQKRFDKKVGQLASIVCLMNGGNGPDILGVCEVENRYVLDQLVARVNASLPGRSYSIVHTDAARDQRGIDTAFLFDGPKYTVDPAEVFSHFVLRRTGTRDITQVTFTTQKKRELVALCNHWPSRSGGAYESRGFRMTAGETLAYWHQRILEEKGPGTPILAMGDFNDDPFDESLMIHAMATRERGDVTRSTSAARFYNLTWRYMVQETKDCKGKKKLLHGTIYYGGNGFLFDQLLVSKGLLLQKSPIRVDEASARIEAHPIMVSTSVSQGPIRFGLPKGNAKKNLDEGGFSDHFPVSVVLKES